jgi:hypothetical protein
MSQDSSNAMVSSFSMQYTVKPLFQLTNNSLHKASVEQDSAKTLFPCNRTDIIQSGIVSLPGI